MQGLLVELRSLLGREGGVVKVVETHGATYFGHGLCSSLTGDLGTTAQDVDDGGDVLLQFGTTLTDGLQRLLKHGGEELLYFHVAETATAVVGLQLVEVGIVGQVAAEMLLAAEGVEVGEDSVALDLSRIADTQVVGVVNIDLTFFSTSSALSLR